MVHAPDTYVVSARGVLGKNVRRLRREGVLPANIFGRGLESVAVQMPQRAAREMLLAHGTDTLIQLSIEGEPRPRPVVVRAFQRHPVSREVLHVDFYQVELDRLMQGTVPVHIVGEAPAVHMLQGVLLTGADSIQVEALPADMPEAIEVSVDGLTELDAQVTVADLVLPASVRVMTEPEVMLARVARPRVASEAEVLEGEEPEAAAEGGSEGGAEEGAAE